MKTFGSVLLTLGFVVGSYLAVLEPRDLDWRFFLPALLVSAAGMAMIRFGGMQAATAEERLVSDIENARDSLDTIVEAARRLDEESREIDPYEVHVLIDQRFPDALDTFVRARQSLSHRFGLQAYADIMSAFASGERYLNRAWSASADGYVNEVIASLERARSDFESAQGLLAGYLRS